MLRQYKTFLFIMLILSIFALQFVSAKDVSLKGKIITVDSGHGGRDPGTRYGNILEKDLNLQISKQLKKELQKKGATVYMIRDKDEDLSLETDSRKKRSDLYRRLIKIKNNKSDLYLSIHLNWYNDYYYGGVEVLYNNINKKNKVLATKISNSFKNNNIKTRSIKETSLYMYRNTYTPGVLIECGFLSNKNDRYLLQKASYQKKIAKIITNGVINYFE